MKTQIILVAILLFFVINLEAQTLKRVYWTPDELENITLMMGTQYNSEKLQLLIKFKEKKDNFYSLVFSADRAKVYYPHNYQLLCRQIKSGEVMGAVYRTYWKERFYGLPIVKDTRRLTGFIYLNAVPEEQ